MTQDKDTQEARERIAAALNRNHFQDRAKSIRENDGRYIDVPESIAIQALSLALAERDKAREMLEVWKATAEGEAQAYQECREERDAMREAIKAYISERDELERALERFNGLSNTSLAIDTARNKERRAFIAMRQLFRNPASARSILAGGGE